MAVVLGLSGACGGGDEDDVPDGGSDARGTVDAATPDATVVPDAMPEDQRLGSACTCDGTACASFGVPRPAGGTIHGCDEVPDDFPGGALACLRSYGGTLSTKTYFANGYCSVMATSCEGASLICDSAVFGSYATMVACPEGTVMIQDTQLVSALGQSATVRNKVCAAPCDTSADCREGEQDPEHQGPAQYQCVDRAGVKFCYDPRNLGPDYTATSF